MKYTLSDRTTEVIRSNFNELFALSGEDHFFLIDDNIACLYPGLFKACRKQYIIEAAETNKSIARASEIFNWLLVDKANRFSTLVAIGGGITTDLGGWVASNYMRGINLILVPTTLIAMIDAALGGKTALNFLGTKNLVGSFYPAEKVLLIPEFLKTLPEDNILEGKAELYKTALLEQKNLLIKIFDHDWNDHAKLSTSIIEAADFKLKICQHDLYDKGERRFLNLGHTFAHIIESCMNYEISHGRAVALGIASSAKISRTKELISVKRFEEIITQLFDLFPADFLSIDRSEFSNIEKFGRSYFLRDKKAGKSGKAILFSDEKGFTIESGISWNEMLDALKIIMGGNMAALPMIKDQDLKGKTALVRVDHNVVKKGKIKDPYRIDASIPTLKYLVENGAKVILMSHVGRPRDKKTGNITISNESSVKPIVEYLNQAGFNAVEMTTPDHDESGITNLAATQEIIDLEAGKYDIVYLPNTRWFAGEEAKDEKREQLGEELADLADIFVNDAFGSWQPHASTIEPVKHLPSFAGFLMQKEISHLNEVLSPKRPFVAVIAGSKFDTKIAPLSALLEKADHLVLGGVIYNAYLSAKYGFKIKGITDADLESAREFVELAKKHSGKIVELPFIIESDDLDEKTPESFRVKDIRDLKATDTLNFVLDADIASFELPEVKKIFANAGTFFVNAVMGKTPQFTEGTIALDSIISENANARKLFGGGDTLQEMKTLVPKIYEAALKDDNYYFFTGGGTILKAISADSPYGLEPVQALLDQD